MENFMQFITDNIGSVMTILGSSAVLQAAISVLVAIILKVRNGKAANAYMNMLQMRSAADFDMKLAQERERLIDEFTNIAANATKLVVEQLCTEIAVGNNTALVNVNAYIETILSAEGNEQIRIDYEAVRAPMAKAARRNAVSFDADLSKLLAAADVPPTPVEIETATNDLTESVTVAESAAALAEEVTEYDV